jgi:polysaccharide pyruvyl transferase WcaK-like protein
MLKHAARAADYCSFRDQYSKNFANGMGLDTRANPVYPDLVFRLPIPPTKSDSSVTRGLTVGLGVMSYNGWQGHLTSETVVYDTYLAEMKRFVVWLLQGGYRVRLLVGEITDQQTVEDLRGLVLAEPANLPDGAELVADPANSLRDVMEQVADTDIVVASRFHNIIAALTQARPTISISYTPKHDELMREMGLEMFCQPIEQLDADRLIQQFQDLVPARVAVAQRIADKIRAYKERLAEQDRVLLALLG